jgi:hypothetical protein
MIYGLDENSVIKTFSTGCFTVMAILIGFFTFYELIGENGLWLAYRALEFAIYGVFAMGFYKIIKLLSQLVGEMKFFRHHYILKDKKEKRIDG